MAARDLIIRIGLDASPYNKGMDAAKKKAQQTGTEISQRLNVAAAKAQPGTTVSDRVGALLNPESTKFVTEVTRDNLAAAKRQAEDLAAMLTKLQAKGVTSKTAGADGEMLMELKGRYEAVSDAIREYEDQVRAAIAAQQKSAAETASQTVETKRHASALSQLKAAGRNASSAFSDISKSVKKTNTDISGIVRSIRNVGIVSIGFRIAGAALGRLRSIVSDYISSNDQLQAQVNGLKTAMGQALAPAINLVVNAMSKLMPYVLGIANAIGSLIGNLFGTGWTTAAAGASKTAASTKQAAAAQKEMNRQLLGFDQITRLENQDQSSTATTTPSGGSNAPTTSISSKTPAWLERFKRSFSDLFNNPDFKAANFGGKLGKVLQTGIDWIGSEAMRFDWTSAGKKLYNNWAEFWESGVADSFGRTAGVAIGGSLSFLWGFLTAPFSKISDKFKNEGFSSGLSYVAGILARLSNPLSWFSPVLDGFVDYFKTKAANIVSGFFDSFSLRWDQLRSGITDKLSGLKNSVTNIAAKIKGAFHFSWSLPKIKVPHLSVAWQDAGVLSKFFGVSKIPHMSVQWYAKGGILDGAQIFGRMGRSLLGGGEAGREAVLPLDRHTEWMDKIADRVVSKLGTGGDVTANIYLTVDGKLLTKYVITQLRAQARAGGKTVLGGA